MECSTVGHLIERHGETVDAFQEHPPCLRRGGHVSAPQCVRGAPFEGKHLARREKRQIWARASHAHAREPRLHVRSPQPMDQVIGRRVVADGDHLLRVAAQRDVATCRLVAQVAARQALPGVVDGEALVPRRRALGDRRGECPENVELEGRADSSDTLGLALVDRRLATHLDRQQRGLPCQFGESFIDLVPARRLRSRRVGPEEQPGDTPRS